MIYMPQSDDDYAKLHSRSYVESPVTPAEARRQTICSCTRSRPWAEEVRDGAEKITLINCLNCGRSIPGAPK